MVSAPEGGPLRPQPRTRTLKRTSFHFLAPSHYTSKPTAASGSDHYYLAHKPFWDKILQQRTNSNVAKRKFDGEG